jgi:hypothetical protein
VDVFVDELDLPRLGFAGPATTGRPGYSPATMLKLYLYGYLNQVQSSRRPEREAVRNVECMWLTGKLAPDFKTIADFRRDNGEAITLNAPETLNAFTGPMHTSMSRIWDDGNDDPDAHVVVLTGAGRAFSAGGNVIAMQKKIDHPDA